MKTIKFFSLIAILSLFIHGCAPLVIAGGGLAVGAAAQERSVGNAIDDTTIWTRIKNGFLADPRGKELVMKVGVKVLEGRVLLTGTVDKPEDRIVALKIVWSQEGVREVINEIKIAEYTDKNKIKDFAVDSWITTQIKSKLLIDKGIKSINYSVETIDRVVYLIGIAQNEAELDKVTHIASTIKNVEKVVSYVRMKDSPTRKLMLRTHY